MDPWMLLSSTTNIQRNTSVSLTKTELQVSLKAIGEAVSRCIELKEVFGRDCITAALSNLVQRQPLPPLIMRTMIHTYTAHVESRRCVCPLLLVMPDVKIAIPFGQSS